MIVELKTGGELIIAECCPAPGAYIAVGNMRGSQGVMADPRELEIIIATLTAIREAVAEREKPSNEKDKAA